MTKFFKAIRKATCNIIVKENDLASAIKTLECYDLSSNISITCCGKRTSEGADEYYIKFRTTGPKWDNVVDDLLLECKSKIMSAITDQFGKVYYIELT